MLHLFNKFYDSSLVRNIDVSYSGLIYHTGNQLNLFEEAIKNEKLDQIREKYSFVSIIRASSTLEHARSLDRANLVEVHAGRLDRL